MDPTANGSSLPTTRASVVVHLDERPDVFFPEPPTDGAFFHTNGVPLVQLLASPSYLFDAADTIDKIHGPSIEPIGRAVVNIIASTAGMSAATMRSGVEVRS